MTGQRTSPMKTRTIVALCVGGLALVIILPLIIAFVAGFMQGYAGREPDFAAAFPAIVSPLIIGLMVTALIGTLVWMRLIDEAAREAHKFAWYWGGLSGLAAGGVFVILATLPQAAAFDAQATFGIRDDPAAYMALGATLLAAVMTAGYLVAWAAWWLKRR